ncbi:hypothetical protein [Kaistella carnis]|uniref:Uncharacterized protein n=1 Tax=Kaistella carnis TaxID=1241979 RepID=A0A3G8XL41_9FLAO|nr:hypothetical protein [Kaistella carnis]AZI32437.1 hypothetical protein EIB73_04220 [Kaistella carnis]
MDEKIKRIIFIKKDMLKVVVCSSVFLLMVNCDKANTALESKSNTDSKKTVESASKNEDIRVAEKISIKDNILRPEVTEKTTATNAEIFQKFEESTYDRTDLKERLENHKTALASLSDHKIFKAISGPLLKKLSSQHQSFFSAHPQYELLSVTKGSLTSAEESDHVFILFDKNQSIIKIFVYQADKNSYRELYRTAKVENGLEDAGCNYSTFGTLDYQMGEEIIEQKDFLGKNVGQFFIAKPIILQGLKKDENFAPEHGCFSKGMSTAKKVRFVAIPTSQVYSNWECLTYQSSSDSFLIFYGQAFAD